ncbi:MAG: hypothetical protein KME10_19710 [Plectolyngbya sp. WJT66-NPBG17]|jgi:hypothetical protein|nr:hypothetical protein [Plectolyngbya sp. WJT66-NPBG17]MBW4528281.1 hypothetical protein [Phormidium tanganyikae FI6-MK23]
MTSQNPAGKKTGEIANSLETNAIAQLTQALTSVMEGLPIRITLLPTDIKPLGIGQYLSIRPATPTQSAQYVQGIRLSAIATFSSTTPTNETPSTQIAQRLLIQRANLRSQGILSAQPSEFANTYQILYEFIGQIAPTEGIIQSIVIDTANS